jgi:hypothetical protein
MIKFRLTNGNDVILPFKASVYYNLLGQLEDAQELDDEHCYDFELRNTIRRLIKTCGKEELPCLIFLIKELYQEHFHMVEKLAVLI